MNEEKERKTTQAGSELSARLGRDPGFALRQAETMGNPRGRWIERPVAYRHERMSAGKTQAERLNGRIGEPNGIQTNLVFEA